MQEIKVSPVSNHDKIEYENRKHNQRIRHENYYLVSRCLLLSFQNNFPKKVIENEVIRVIFSKTS